jgi:long-chain acyl-CoA synthetase
VAGLRLRFEELLAEVAEGVPAVEFEDVWFSWGQMRSVRDQLDAALTKHGLEKAARVGIVLENRPEHVAVLVASIATDRCLVMLSPLQPPERLGADIERSDVPVVVASPVTLARPGVQEAALATGLVLALDSDGSLTVVGGSADGSERRANPGIAVEMMTSGTTGPPKRVDLSDRQVDRAIQASASLPRDGKLLRLSVSLVVAPLVHIGGLWSVLAPLYAGRRLAMLTKFAVEPWVELVERHRPRAAGLVPAALRAVLDADVDPARLGSLRW